MSITIPIVLVCWPTRIDRFVVGLLGVIWGAAVTLDGRGGGEQLTGGDGRVVAQLLLLLVAYTSFGFPAHSERGRIVATISRMGICMGGAVAAAVTASWPAGVVFIIAGVVVASRSRTLWTRPSTYVEIALTSAAFALACIWFAAD